MILEISLNNIDIIKPFSEIYNMVISSFKSNPFAGFFVYLEHNTVIGYLYYSEIYDRIEINEICVFDKYRRCGNASEMMEKLIKKNKGISLEVRCDNIPAIKLYEKFGFEKAAVRSGYYDGIDGYLMILEMK